jgi:hypothetical protein
MSHVTKMQRMEIQNFNFSNILIFCQKIYFFYQKSVKFFCLTQQLLFEKCLVFDDYMLISVWTHERAREYIFDPTTGFFKNGLHHLKTGHFLHNNGFLSKMGIWTFSRQKVKFHEWPYRPVAHECDYIDHSAIIFLQNTSLTQ